MPVFPLSVSLNQITSITFLPEKAKREKKKEKRRNTCVEKTKQNKTKQKTTTK